MLGEALDAYTSGEMWHTFLDTWIVLQIVVVIILVGFVMAAVSWFRRLSTTRRALRSWTMTKARIVSFTGYKNRKESVGPYDRWFGTYEYRDRSGKTHQGKFTGEDREPRRGQSRTVYVNPRKPSQSIDADRKDLTAFSIIVAIIFWFVMLAIALFFFYLFLSTP